MNLKYSLGLFGQIIVGTLKEVRKREYELSISHKGVVGKVFYDANTHNTNYGIFVEDYLKLNRNMRAATDQAIWHYIKETKEKA